MQLNVVKLNQELSALRISKEESVKNMTALETEKKTLEATIVELQAKVTALETEKATIKKDEAAVIVAVEESVNKKVVQNLASIGVPEGTVKDVVAEVVKVDATKIYEKFESLSGKEKVEFFKQNEKAIMKAMKSSHFDNNPLAIKIATQNTKF